MSRHESFINRAIGVALTSNCRWRHGSVITKGSRVVAHSPNVYRNDPSLDHSNSSWHAEEAAIRHLHRVTGKAYGYDSFKGYSLYVARVNTKGDPSLSRPCGKCWALLMHSGIVDVYYTNELGTVSHEIVL